MENVLQKLGVVRQMELWLKRVQECRSSGKEYLKKIFGKLS